MSWPGGTIRAMGALRCRDLKKHIPLAPSPDTVPRCRCRELPADTALSSLLAPHKSCQPPLPDGGRAAGIPTHTREFPRSLGRAHPHGRSRLWRDAADGRLRGYAVTHTGGTQEPLIQLRTPVPLPAAASSLCAHTNTHTHGASGAHSAVNTTLCTDTSGETGDDGCFISAGSTHTKSGAKAG